MVTVNHVTREVIHIVNISDVRNLIRPAQEEEATVYICVASRCWHAVAMLKPIPKKSADTQRSQ